MASNELRKLLKQERQIRSIMDAMKEFRQNYNEVRDKSSLLIRIRKLDDVYELFCEVRMQIELIIEDTDGSEEFVDPDETVDAQARKMAANKHKRDMDNAQILKEFISEYFVLKQSLEDLLCPSMLNPAAGPAPSISQQHSSVSMMRVKLPELKLPTFSGTLRDWITFRDTFKNLISDNAHLSEIDKFTYLRSSLSGEALQEIGSIELTSDNYSIAWSQLESRYENKKLLVKSHLDALLSIDQMKRETFESLNHLLNEFEKHLQILGKLGEETANWSTILAHILASKLDAATLRLWETEHRSREVPTCTKMLQFLKNHCIVLQSVMPKSCHPSDSKRSQRSFSSYAGTQVACPFCSDEKHFGSQCKKFRSMKVEERRNAVKNNRLCFNCLSRGHGSKSCSRGSCRVCGQRHHTMLHLSSNQTDNTSPVSQPTRPQPTLGNPHTTQTPTTSRPQNQAHTQTHQQVPNQNTQNALSIPSSRTHAQTPPTTDTTTNHNIVLSANETKASRSVLLATALVILEDHFGNSILARALLDSGSQLCFMSENISQRLKFKRSKETLSISGIGQTTKKCKQSVVARIRSRVSCFAEKETFYVIPQVTQNLPLARIDTNDLNIPADLALADPHFFEPGSIDLLIGAELFYDVLSADKLKLGDNGPTLQNSAFGWIVCGRVLNCTSHQPVVASACGDRLDNLITRFWELETCRSTSTLSIEEEACETWFDRTTIRDTRGRFIVTLPKKDHLISRLGDSKNTALKRFLALERRLAGNDKIKQMYIQFVEEYLRMGHMREVTEDKESTAQQYYIPHHCVLKPESSSTKLRVVFDASCSTTSGISLNDALMVGPTVQDDLLSIVMRFRLHRFAIVADIEKMYRMVHVQQRDWQFQRIFWRSNPNEFIRIFELKTVTYGTASAPYLATKCLKRLAELDGGTFPDAAKVLAEDFYVDDMMSGVDSIEEGVQLCAEIQRLLSGGGFTLRKWSSNCPAVLERIPEDCKDERTCFELDDSSATVKTLGLIWEPRSDCFKFKVPAWNPSDICKRVVVSDLARVFDPLGLVSPIIVAAKIFLQSLWQQKVTWDDILATNLQSFWIEFRRSLDRLEDLRVPRWLAFGKDCRSIQLHGFCDASEKAYGACIYLRCTHFDGSVTSRLIAAKSRVAPIEDVKGRKKKLSIPRLELSSALVLAHLHEKVIRSLKLTVRRWFWTDSEIVRYWLASSPSRWQMFVANRVSEIQHSTREGKWNHVPGTENPADVLSRGTVAEQLLENQLWWNGPSWLVQDESTWPMADDVPLTNFDTRFLEENTAISVVANMAPPNEIFSLRSSLMDLVKLTAWLLRFIHNTRQKNHSDRRHGALMFAEREAALIQLVKLAQRERFDQDIKELLRKNQVKSSSRLNSLCPRLLDGVIRVGGRLANAQISAGRKHPIILDKDHPLTTLVMLHYHHKMLHAGQQLLIASVRDRFWPIGVCSLARQTIHRCVTCFRNKPTVHEQLMADLPSERVTPAPPFLRVGVDYCGPFQVVYPNRRAVPVKYYAAIFVCLVTKSVHIETAADLTTAAFLAAFRRFAARRGKPSVVMCDNGCNFVGARRELDELRRVFLAQQSQQTIVSEAADEGIEFKFIPAKSPNFGGLWEAAVKSMKQHLRRAIGTKTLTPDELQTVLVQIEACLNSRPLTPLSNDPGDFEALTPGHFLSQRPLTAIPEPSLQEVPENRLSRWQRTQDFLQRIWRKWSTQYLSDLHNRTKWTRQRNNLFVGTMVLVKEDNLPPLKWALGRVSHVTKGADGNIRVVTVKTKDGSYTRAISKICVLPIRDNDQIGVEGKN
ncbi:uncharacterized protein LOC128740701 [Sabethes cyaneus]|uniref:uncharacterized protein LOC128740701 n=1 Tax=Sabethes cyaneus TaxID=53552 RepID=UPI00237EE839|nr:uncharacterized protein LOC128740701 [Sabethes cyaneus]